MQAEYKVVVITAALNAVDCIERCVESVQSQSYGISSHIIIDGGSIDGTYEKVLSLTKQTRYDIQVIREPDDGLYHAINKALMRFDFDFYVVLGADDELLKDGIKILVTYANNGSVIQGLAKKCSGKTVRAHSGATLIKRRLHEHYGLYDCQYRIAGDTKFMGAVRVGGEVIVDVDVVVSIFNDGGLSTNDIYRATKEHAKALYAVGEFSLIRYLIYRLTRWAKYLMGFYD